MSKPIRGFFLAPLIFTVASFLFAIPAYASLTLTAGNNATTTPNVATSITGFQIVGPAASTTPVKLRTTSGTLNLSVVSGVTMSGNNSTTVNLSGNVENLNTALSTLKYTRGSNGTDTLEVSLVEPTEVFFDDNGHLYQFISGSFTWNQAKTAAEARTAYGATGYLATITSSAENSFVYARITGNGWIGATDTDVERTWKWMTGPEAGTAFFTQSGFSGGNAIDGQYNAWNPGEPNDYNNGNPGEDCAHMYSSGGQAGTWNDFPCDSALGYVVEFGGDSEDLPTVVAQNISIVTADVPALTALSPTNGASSISPSANLIMTFSKTVTKQTGSILIRRSSNDEIVATIDVSSDAVTATASTTAIINPSVDLEEGVQYYVTVPGTAFSDSSSNFFSGISNDSTWVFTTADVTAPVISNLSATVATTTSTITWSTNEAASTRLWYSSDLSYASSTSESNTSTRVTSHEVSLSDLVDCTMYQYRAVSRDAFGNTATSSEASFITRGCAGSVIPTSSTTTTVSVNSSATSTLAQNNRILTVNTPAEFTATSSSLVVQIKSLAASTVLSSIGTPTIYLSSAASIVFDVIVLIDNETVLDSFDLPITISYTYTDEDFAGLDESSIWLYHYHNEEWEALDDCILDISNNNITCTTESFSVFGLFGTETAEVSSVSSSGITLAGRISNAFARGDLASALGLLRDYIRIFFGSESVVTVPENSFQTEAVLIRSDSTPVVRDLELGMEGEDVIKLQEWLIAQGYQITAGATGYFGLQTQYALDAYQTANNIVPRGGYFGPITRVQMKSAGHVGLWW